MNSIAYFVLTLGCGILCLLGAIDVMPAFLFAPIILLISGYSLLGPRFAASTRGIELAAMYLGTSIGISVLVGIGLSRLSIAISSRNILLSYALVFGAAALAWFLTNRSRSPAAAKTVQRGRPSWPQLVGSVVAILLASVGTALLVTAPSREGPVIELAVIPRDPTDELYYQAREAIELEAQVVLPSAAFPDAVLVVRTSTGQSSVVALQRLPGAQTVPIVVMAPSEGGSTFVVKAIVEDGGVSISPEVRLNLRPNQMQGE